MTTAPQPKTALLESLANQFAPHTKQNQSLERHRQAVLMFRARGATYPQIRNLLERHGILVSDTSLSRFCCKYAADIARLRLQLEQELDGGFIPSVATAPVVPSSQAASLSPVSSPSTLTAPLARKQRDLRGDV